MPEFERIKDPRRRLLARLNLALRQGHAEKYEDWPLGSLVISMFEADQISFIDFERDVLADYLLRTLEDEIGAPAETWSDSREQAMQFIRLVMVAHHESAARAEDADRARALADQFGIPYTERDGVIFLAAAEDMAWPYDGLLDA